MKDIFEKIVEKGRVAQWLGIIVCGGVAYAGGEGGWLDQEGIVEVIKYSVYLAGGIELLKRLTKDD